MTDNPRQAVILIHGIGEQRPMETLRAFVDGILDYKFTGSLVDTKYYSKPDLISETFELRRLVSAGGRTDRTDFYEYYWAHLMPTAAWDRIMSWFSILMYRGWNDVPPRIRPIWAASWVAATVLAILGLLSIWRFASSSTATAGLLDDVPWFLLAVFAVISAGIRSYIGDAAVYLSPAPANIEARQHIRSTGLKLLENIIASGRYDRVIVVGHSLGSVIGYDILTLAWQRHFDTVRQHLSAEWIGGRPPVIKDAAITAAEKLAKEIRDIKHPTAKQTETFAAKWRQATWAVAKEQALNGYPWIVSDFVTLGSPLTHGDLLLAKNSQDFIRRTMERELPHCPPTRELHGAFSFQHKDIDKDGKQHRATVLNNAALFAATAWTNHYFKSVGLLYGDYIGGQLAPLFWAGVRDVAVKTRKRAGWFAHTSYWARDERDTDQAGAPLLCLKTALDLNRDRPWPPIEDVAAESVETASVDADKN